MPLAAIGQIRSTVSMTHNLSQCQTLVQKASEAGAKALFLPEASDYIGPPSLCKPIATSLFVLGLQSSAAKYKLPVHVGIHEPGAGSKIKNTLIWINAEGEIAQRYQKIHLFDVDIANGPSLKESDNVEAGTHLLAPFPSPLGTIGAQICFDMRFPIPAQVLRSHSAQILTYPSAFTSATGRAGHWEALLRARAIETQSYVIAAAQVGVHDEVGKRRSWGHSMIVDPWGKIVAELGGDKGVDWEGVDKRWDDECEIGLAEVDLEMCERVRREVPLVGRERYEVE